jgi:hypothetical protein
VSHAGRCEEVRARRASITDVGRLSDDHAACASTHGGMWRSDATDSPTRGLAKRRRAMRITEGMNDHRLSMVPLLVQSRDVPAPVREALQTFMRDPSRTDAGCEAASGLLRNFDLSKGEVMDLLGVEQSLCC